MIFAWTGRYPGHGIIVWTSASERASAGLERHWHLAHCAVGSVGRPASALRRGEFVNIELTVNGLEIAPGQYGSVMK